MSTKMTDSLTPSNKDSLSLNLFYGDDSSPANPIGSNGSPLVASEMDVIAHEFLDKYPLL